MGNGYVCSTPEKKYKNIQQQYSMIDLLIGLRPNNKLYELNALLQCLCHIESLVNSFKYKFDKIKTYICYKKYTKNRKCLTDYFKSIVDSLWPDLVYDKSEIKTHKASQSSNEFLNMIYQINPDYNENKEYLLKFLQKRLHEELNKKEKQNSNSNTIDLSDKNASFENYKNNFEKNDQSIISVFFMEHIIHNLNFFVAIRNMIFNHIPLDFILFNKYYNIK